MKTLSTKSTKSRRIYLQLITYITYMYCIRIVSYFRCKIYDNKWSTKCVGLQMAGRAPLHTGTANTFGFKFIYIISNVYF